MFGVIGELGVLGKQSTSSKAVMLYTLTMTSDVNFFNATVRGLENKELVVQARRRHGLKTMDGVMPIPRKPSEAEHEAIRGRLMSALGAVLEEHCVQTWLWLRARGRHCRSEELRCIVFESSTKRSPAADGRPRPNARSVRARLFTGSLAANPSQLEC